MHDYAQPEGATDGGSGTGAHGRRRRESARISLAGQRTLLLACMAAAVILIVDDVLFGYSLPLRVTAPLDELAHAATMVVVVCALPGRVPRAFVVGSLLGAVMLDVDHLSVTFHMHAWAPVHGRPYSHSLVVVVAVTLLMAPSRRWRVLGVGMACGLLSHLFRDLATGVAPLFWPLTTVQLSIPHSLYEAALIGVLGWTVVYKQGGAN
jgi:inner membrane protein